MTSDEGGGVTGVAGLLGYGLFSAGGGPAAGELVPEGLDLFAEGGELLVLGLDGGDCHARVPVEVDALAGRADRGGGRGLVVDDEAEVLFLAA